MKTSTSAHRHLPDCVRSALATLVLLAIAVVLSGCTAVGFTIGAIVDDAAARRELAHTERIPTGTRVRVQLHSGDDVQGTLASVHRVPAEEYAARYASWRDALEPSARPPGIGDSVALPTWNGPAGVGRFVGFRTEGIVLVGGNGHERVIAFDSLAGPWRPAAPTSMASISSVRADRRHLQDALRLAPRLDAIMISTPAGDRVLAAEEIQRISVSKRIAGRWTGTLLGLCADAIALSYLVSHIEVELPADFLRP